MGTWRKHTGELARGYFAGTTAPITAAAAGVFVVTAVVAIMAHTKTWPDGAWPWLLVLACVLLVIASIKNALAFMGQRDGANSELSRHLDSAQYLFDLEGVTSGPIAPDPHSPNCVLPLQFVLSFENIDTESPIKYHIRKADFIVGSQSSDPVESDATGIIAAGKRKAYVCGMLSGVTRNDIRQLYPICTYEIDYGHPLAEHLPFKTRAKLRLFAAEQTSDGYPAAWNYVSEMGPTYELNKTVADDAS